MFFLSHQTTLGCAVIQLPNLFGSMYTWITRYVFAKENSSTSIESSKTNEEHEKIILGWKCQETNDKHTIFGSGEVLRAKLLIFCLVRTACIQE